MRYTQLLEGLEITIQNFKSLESIIDYRLEAEYFDKRFLKIDEIFSKKKTVSFFNVADYENGKAYNSEHFSNLFIENGVKVSKIGDVTQKRLNENWVWVSLPEFEKQNGKYLVDDDILMTLTGDPPDVGKVNIFKKNSIKSTWNQRVARIFLKKGQEMFYSRQVLFVVLSNKYCREQLERYAKGIRQRNLGTECIEKLKLPVLQKEFQVLLDDFVSVSFKKGKESKERYVQAENLLLETLDLQCFQPSAEAVNVKSLEESFLNSGRLDAEYYQRKYEDLFQRITNQKYKTLGELVNIKKSIEPGSSAYQNEGIPFVRISNLSKFEISQPEIHLDKKEYEHIIKPKKNTILLSKDGSVGIAYKVEKDLNCITSGAILHLEMKDKEVLPDYLTLVLNSLVVGLQAERDAGGSIIQHWKPSEIQEVIVPVIDKNIQIQITELLQESFALRVESERLLGAAKEAVEIAIEENEEKAMEFIKENKM